MQITKLLYVLLLSTLLFTICFASTADIPVEPTSEIVLEHADIVQQIQKLFEDQPEILNSKGLFDIWKFFRIIGNIPRESRNTKAMVAWLRQFAEQKGYKTKEDKVGNIVIQIPAQPGFEHLPTLVLQAHTDMVCEKNSNKQFDFQKDAIEWVRKGDFIHANDTTLGADNGMGMALSLAFSQDPEIKARGPLELLFTTDEEIGLLGAAQMEPGMASGQLLINLDTSFQKGFFVGCAGGVNTVAEYKLERETVADSAVFYKIFVSGFSGAHSGAEIHVQRGNAIKTGALLLARLREWNVQIDFIEGGSAHNAVPREVSIGIVLPSEDLKSKLDTLISEFEAQTKILYFKTDPNIKITATPYVSTLKTAFTASATSNFIQVLSAIPHGVLRWSHRIEGMVETSTNLAVIKTADSTVTIVTSQRSNSEFDLDNAKIMIESFFYASQAHKVTSAGFYSPWEPNYTGNTLLELAKESYKEMYQREAQLQNVHAGIEPGLILKKNPSVKEAISFGAEVFQMHSPSEHVQISSVTQAYQLLKSINEKIVQYFGQK